VTSGRNIPRSQRRRPKLELTLSPEALDRLERLADRRGEPRSRVVEELILAAPLR
jgi:predicted DNA-binding protein